MLNQTKNEFATYHLTNSQYLSSQYIRKPELSEISEVPELSAISEVPELSEFPRSWIILQKALYLREKTLLCFIQRHKLQIAGYKLNKMRHMKLNCLDLLLWHFLRLGMVVIKYRPSSMELMHLVVSIWMISF